MELQFHKSQIPCLKQIMEEIKDLELTQEIKLPEGMPDIGSVIGTWGQVLIRGKEWRGDQLGASGGVQAWIMYAPEDGSEAKMVEAWMPFQTQWDIPEGQQEGKICLMPCLRLIDSRSVAARRLMLRGAVSLRVKAMIPAGSDIYVPGEVPEDVQLRCSTYPISFPSEAGEKTFVMDEELSLPSVEQGPEKLLRYSLTPEITEVKVMSGRLVFRGNGLLHVMYRSGEDISGFDMSIPFAQFEELEGEYDPDATAWIYPALTSLEAELAEGDKLRLKAGLTCQYVICEQKTITVAQDAYSTGREVKLQLTDLELPAVLDDQQTQIQARCPWNEDGKVLDVAFYPDHPRQIRNADQVEYQLSGRFHLLYRDSEGIVRGSSCKWEEQIPLQAAENSDVTMYGSVTGEQGTDGAQLQLRTVCIADQGMPCVSGLELGEKVYKDPTRPSVLLRRADGEDLWQLAKAAGSTVSAIQAANGLEDESPDPARMLLIPVP